MLWMRWLRGPLMAPADGGAAGVPGATGQPPGGTAQPPPATPPATPPAQPPLPGVQDPPDPDADGNGNITLSSDALRKRMERSRAAFLRQNGFESEEQFRAFKADADRRAAEEEERRRAQLSKEQQLEEDLARERAARAEAEAAAEQQQWRQHVGDACARLGVRNVGYARYELEQVIEGLGEGEQLDVEAWLKERLDPAKQEHAAMRAAFLGQPPAPAPRPGVTTTPPGGPTPPAPPPGGGGVQPSNAFDMDQKQWAEHLAKYGAS